MWAKRIGALLLAVALVAVAFVVRDRRSADGDAGSTPTGPTTPGATTPGGTVPSGTLRLICATELAAACADAAALGAKVSATVEPAGTTAARFVAADEPAAVADAWLTVDPWPAFVDQERRAKTFEPFFGTDGTRIAHSPIGVAVRKGRSAALAEACGGTVTLACVGDKGGASWSDLGGQVAWQRFRPTLNDPTASATGPAALAAAVRQRRNDDSTLTLDQLQADTSFVSWLGGFERSTLTGGTPLEQSVLVPKYDGVVVSQAELASTRGAANVFDFVGATPFVAEVTVIGRSGTTVPAATVEVLTERLAGVGWAKGEDPSNRIDATLVAGMQRIWKET